jgi:hypothetical protein
MRLREASADVSGDTRAFSDFLMRIGDGRHDQHGNLPREYARMPSDLLLTPASEEMGDLIDRFKLNIRKVVDHLYGEMSGADACSFANLCDRAILCRVAN